VDLEAWQLWVIAGLVLGVFEIKISGFVFAWFAVGALLAAVVAALDFGLTAQTLTFAAVSLALFGASRTIFSSLLMRRAGADVKVGTDAMLGAEATVVDALPENGNGTVRINGELWHAKSVDGPMPVGSTVVVESVEGLKLKVRDPGRLVVGWKEK
jgi:membrane protein implicated in regulation of membrane protease activity